MQYQQTFYAYERLIGGGLRPTSWVGNTPVPPLSRLWVCRYCSTAYGKLVIPGQPFQLYSSCCEACWLAGRGGVFDYPDSFYCPLDDLHNTHFPEPILLWELHSLELKLLRGNTDGTTTCESDTEAS